MKNEPTTPPNAKEAAPVEKTLLTWHSDKKTKRDLLAIAVTLRGWDPEQTPGSLDETTLTEAEFLAAIEDAKKIYADALKDAGRPTRMKVLVHDKVLLATIIKRPTQAVADKMVKVMQDDETSEEETLAQLRSTLTQHILWPKEGSEPFAFVMEVMPIAFGHVFPKMLLNTLGADTLGTKKRG